jgi:malate dehydrogenase (oxaloacetate-decarboxylating)
MQGTGAITLAAAISAVRVCGTPLRNQRVVIHGAGTAGIGVADQIRDAMVREGLSKEDAARRFWCLDRHGLLTAGMPGGLQDHQAAYARPDAESQSWKRDGSGKGVGLAEVVRRVKPTMLIGASTIGAVLQRRSFVKWPRIQTGRSLCHPHARAAANPADLLAWTDGRALIATGSPFAPVTYKGVTYVIGQLNNAMLYPGLALGAIVARASRISEAMFAAAASAVSSLVTVRQPGASLLPQVDDLRSVSATVAVAVAEAADAEGVARVKLDDIVQQVQDSMWQPEYRLLQAS